MTARALDVTAVVTKTTAETGGGSRRRRLGRRGCRGLSTRADRIVSERRGPCARIDSG